MGFDVSAGGEERITLVAEQGGVEHRLVHVLRQPTSSELRRYSKERSEVEFRRRRVTSKRSPAEVDEWLWNQIAVNVEGYTVDGAPLDSSRPDWKERVLLTHKVEAISALHEVAVEEGEAEKNSREPSAEF